MKNKFVVFSLIFTLSFAFIFSGDVNAADFDVNPGESIQLAIDNASDGDTIIVNAGTYDESLVIDGVDIKLIANGEVILMPTSACALHKDVIQAYNADVIIEGFEIDVNYAVSGCEGGIYARGMASLGEGPTHLNALNNNVYNYGKNGITVNGELATAMVKNNIVTGRGDLAYGDHAQNGIQFGWGATGNIMKNLVDGNWYTGGDCMASGILIFQSDNVNVHDNEVLNTQTGIAVETWCYYGVQSASNNRITKNYVEGSSYAVSIAAYDFYSSCDAVANNNKVVNNNLVSTNGEIGVYVGAASYDDGIYTPIADNNKVINNDIEGFLESISDDGINTKVHANTPMMP